MRCARLVVHEMCPSGCSWDVPVWLFKRCARLVVHEMCPFGCSWDVPVWLLMRCARLVVHEMCPFGCSWDVPVSRGTITGSSYTKSTPTFAYFTNLGWEMAGGVWTRASVSEVSSLKQNGINSTHQQLSGTGSFTSLRECKVPCGHGPAMGPEKVQRNPRRVLAKLLNKSHTIDNVCKISKPRITQLEISAFGLCKIAAWYKLCFLLRTNVREIELPTNEKNMFVPPTILTIPLQAASSTGFQRTTSAVLMTSIQWAICLWRT
jgi:hypothetical protein